MKKDLNKKIAQLTPEQRELLERKLLEKSVKKKSVHSIPIRKNLNEFPMSSAQKRLWFLDQLNKGSAFYNIPAALKLTGKLNIQVLKEAITKVLERQQILNVVFNVEGNQPVQKYKPNKFSFDIVNVSSLDKNKINNILDNEATTPFNLTEGPLFRAKLLLLNENENILLITLHHIVADGWSIGILINEVTLFYDSILNNRVAAIEPLKIQFFDYAKWKETSFSAEEEKEHIEFWKKTLEGMPQVLNLPLDRPRPRVQTFNGNKIFFDIPLETANKVKDIGKKLGATPFLTYLAILEILLYRYSSQNDFGIGTLISDRQKKETKDLIGFFVNTLVMRAKIDPKLNFEELLKNVKEFAYNVFEYQTLEFEKVVENLQNDRGLNHSPLFQVMFDYQESPLKNLKFNNISVELIDQNIPTAKFDLLFIVEGNENSVKGSIEYNTDLFEVQTINRIAKSFQILLEQITSNSKKKINELDILEDKERRKILSEWNETNYEIDKNKTVIDYFEEQVNKSPDSIAVIFLNKEQNYSEFNSNVNRLANYLKKKGINQENRVGILLDRSFDLVTALYAVLKLGAVYVPIDPEYPKDRIKYIIEDSKVKIILTSQSLITKINDNSVICIEAERDKILAESSENINAKIHPLGAAYMIYTSGSTGKPKGVIVPHIALVNRLVWMQETFKFSINDRILQKTPFSFDVSVWEFFLPLMFGIKLVIAKPKIHRDPGLLVDCIKSSKVTVLHFVPSMLGVFLDFHEVNKCDSLTTVICSGEVLHNEHQQKFYEKLKNSNLYNLYGPTEAAIDVTYYDANNKFTSNSVPIGKPVFNTQIYVLDKELHPVPVGVAGELHIGGMQLARGYFNRPDLTASKFIPDPFSTIPGQRLYKTGDLVRFLDDGNIEYLNRIDNQIKLRGIRIELGEVENAIRNINGVKESAVIVTDGKNINRKLIGFVVLEEQSDLDVNNLNKFLREYLPEFMIPTYFIEIEEIPLTNNGKIDRKVLLKKSVSVKKVSKSKYVPPRNELEKYLSGFWEEILEVERISIHDDFFKVGGSSIQAAILANKLQNEFNEVFHVGTIFFTPTIYEIAKHLNNYFSSKIIEKFGKDFSEDYNEQVLFNSNNLEPVNKSKIELFNNYIPKLKPKIGYGNKKNKKAIFILSPPRSGSTLFRIMLAGSDKLFVPPELELMAFSSMQERSKAFVNEFSFLKDGMVKAIMEIKDVTEDEAIKFIKQYEDKDLPVQNFYSVLQNLIGDKILVDKTPIYSLNKQILERIEEDFENPLFIHLVRNPYATIYSFIESKMNSFVFRQELPFDIREIAELVWYTSHKNIIEFLSHIPKDRQHQIKFEDLVLNPGKNMKIISNFLGVEFDEKMIMPYNSERMTKGINALVPMVGDLKFYIHKSINPEVLTKWEEKHQFDFLSDESKSLAKKFNYRVKYKELTSSSSARPVKISKFEQYLIDLWEEILNTSNISLSDDFFDLGGNSLLAAVFINRIQKDFNVEVQVQSIFLAPTISEFAHYAKEYYPNLIKEKFKESVQYDLKDLILDNTDKLSYDKIKEFNNIIPQLNELKEEIKAKNPQAVFILSPPRSGSTLLRIMLAGHEKIFSPPELDLLSFNTLAERKEKLAGSYNLWLEATTRAVMELKNCTKDEALTIMTNLEKENVTIKEFYGILQDWAGDRILVDKTPTYALDLNILKRAEDYFENPLYIHLTRHPYASIYSFFEAKLDENFFRYEHPFNRRELAELIWMKNHENIIEFLKNIPKERQIRVKYEDIVTDPQVEMRNLSNFIGIKYDESLIKPYDGKRMTDPVNKNSQMVGDFKFYLRKKIDPNAIHRWKNFHKNDFLSEHAKIISAKLNYDLSSSITLKPNEIKQEYVRIKKVPRDSELQLSFAQQRLWFLDQLEPGKSTYNIPGVVKLKGKLNVNVLEESINEIIKRHESLRTIFPSEEGKARVHILPEMKINLKVKDLTELNNYKLKEKESNDFILHSAKKAFDLSKGPLIRCDLLKLDEEDYILIISTHHIISDGWSSEIFVRELAILYKAFTKGKKSPLSNLPINYVDYAVWQRKWLESGIYDSQINFWKNKLKGIPSLLNLPTDFTRPAVQSQKGKRIQFELDEKLVESLTEIGLKENVTLYIFLLTAFNILLHKYSNSDDIVVGTPVAGRNRNEIEPIIGLFINTIVIRSDLSNDPTFKQLLRKVKENFIEAINNQDIPFEKLVDELNIERSLSHSPLFQVMFVLNNSPLTKIEIDDVSIDPMSIDLGAAKFDITFVLTKRGNRIRGSIEFDRALFKQESIERFSNHYKYLLNLLLKNQNIKLSELELISKDEKNLILNTWNKSESKFPKNKTIHDLFVERAEEIPNNVAVEFNGQTINYGELDKRSNAISNYLIDLGVGKNEVVGINITPSIETIALILGILKSGAAYLSLDPTYPGKRIQYMVKDSNIKIVFITKDLKNKYLNSNIKTIIVDPTNFSEIFNNYENPNATVYPENLAYVIYTSGSTGMPKGVMLSHKGVINHAFDIDKRKPIRNGVCSLWTSLNFDVSIYEIFYPLIFGNELHIVPQEIRILNDELFNWLAEHKVNSGYLPPFTLDEYNDWLEKNPGRCFIRKLMVGVEPIKLKTLSGLYEKVPELLILNGYGPTETTICSTIYEIKEKVFSDDITPIGAAMSNTRIFILDRNMNFTPIGVPGEIYIESEGEARGYLGRPAFTAEKFIPNPFSKTVGKRIYRTGDLAFYQPDGNIKFVGRVDNQVKFKGFRIELGEIEENIKNHPAVNKAAVIIREDKPGIKKLVGYFTLNVGDSIDSSELRNYLSEILPDYMIPSVFVELDEMPKTPNGKIDRKNLPVPTEDDLVLSTEFVEAQGETEEILLKIWKEVLKVNKIGVLDNFFELGGDSILGIQVIAKANKAGLNLSPKNLFEAPTILGLASLANKAKKVIAEQGLISGEVPLTPIQQWFFEQRFKNPNHWNQSILLEVSEKIDTNYFGEAVKEIMKHHDVLRLRHIKSENGYRQIFSEMNSHVPFSVEDLSKIDHEKLSEIISKESEEYQQSLNIEKGPLFRIVYFKLNEEENDRLLIVIHHFVIDGVSWRIVLEDLQTAYEQLKAGREVKLPPKTTSFKYWSEKLISSANEDRWMNESGYWEELIKFSESSKIPTDFTVGENLERTSDMVVLKIPSDKTEILQTETIQKLNTNIVEVLIAAFEYSLSQWSGKRKHIIGMEGHGREDLFDDVDISRTLGWFTSIYPVLIDLKDSVSSIDSLKYIKEQLRKIPNNGIGFGILKYLSTDKKISETMQKINEPDIMFNYLGIFNREEDQKGKFKRANEGKGNERGLENRRAHLLDVSASIVDEELVLHINYSENYHKKETIEKLADLIKNNLVEIIDKTSNDDNIEISAVDFTEADITDDDLDDLLFELDE